MDLTFAKRAIGFLKSLQAVWLGQIVVEDSFRILRTQGRKGSCHSAYILKWVVQWTLTSFKMKIMCHRWIHVDLVVSEMVASFEVHFTTAERRGEVLQAFCQILRSLYSGRSFLGMKPYETQRIGVSCLGLNMFELYWTSATRSSIGTGLRWSKAFWHLRMLGSHSSQANESRIKMNKTDANETQSNLAVSEAIADAWYLRHSWPMLLSILLYCIILYHVHHTGLLRTWVASRYCTWNAGADGFVLTQHSPGGWRARYLPSSPGDRVPSCATLSLACTLETNLHLLYFCNLQPRHFLLYVYTVIALCIYCNIQYIIYTYSYKL